MNKIVYAVFPFVAIISIVSAYTYWHELHDNNYKHKVVVCVPVYGQSLALGEEAIRITDFDSLREKSEGRILTERLDYEFGYFDYSDIRVFARRVLHKHNKSYELSAYGMAESLVSRLGEDTVVCTFPGGQGLTDIRCMSKGTIPYYRFMRNIVRAYKEAKRRGWDFYVPAICWMQGESDIADYPDTDYKSLLKQFSVDINADIRNLTNQSCDVKIVCYQTNTLTKGFRYTSNNYDGSEIIPPSSQMELVRGDSSFWASGPTYPYSFVNENLHIDAVSQKRHGYLAAESVLGVIHNENRQRGVVPMSANVRGDSIIVEMNVPSPPLVIDTSLVAEAPHYGFSVINKNNVDVISGVSLKGDSIVIICSERPDGCKLRYGDNGEFMRSGNRIGPRGNLRDSHGDSHTVTIMDRNYPLHHWCYMFEIKI